MRRGVQSGVEQLSAALADVRERLAALERASSSGGTSGGGGTTGGGSFTFIQESAPTATAFGQTWFNAATASFYVWYDGFWVEVATASQSTVDGGGGGVTPGSSGAAVSGTPPTGAAPGGLWYNTDTGSLFVFHDGYWVEVTSAGTSAAAKVGDGPPTTAVSGDLWFESDTGLFYVFYDGFWIEVGQ